MYKLTLTLNNEKLEQETDDLKKSLLALKPEQIHTEVYITINKDGSIFERKFDLAGAKKLFRDEIQLDLLLNTYNSLYE